MSIKKISGYSVKLSEILGKGSFGSVAYRLFRFIGASKMGPRKYAPSKYYKNISVYHH